MPCHRQAAVLERTVETVYRFTGQDMSELRNGYGELIRREFYDGDLGADICENFCLTAEKAMSHPITLFRTLANSGISYRRGWEHIRSNKTGVRVIWFVRRGAVQLIRSRGSVTIKAGQFTIIDSSIPFNAKGTTDGERFDFVQAIVPAHLFMTHLAAAADLEEPLALAFADRESVVRLLDLLCDLGHDLGSASAEHLVAAFLEALAERLLDATEILSPQERNSQMRLTDIKSCILRNLTDPELNYDDVAAQCGISPRYLYYLLKADNTTFAKLVWSQRLEKARQWLSSADLSNYSIREIAFMSGFKDAAHFSRRFKTAFGFSPKQHRINADLPPAGPAVITRVHRFDIRVAPPAQARRV